MSLLFFSSIIVSLVLCAPIISQPITLGLTLLLLTLIAAVMVAFTARSWIGYIVFIIYIGGVLVIFAYVSALTPNLIFRTSRSFYFIFSLLRIFITLSLTLPNKIISSNLQPQLADFALENTGAVFYSPVNSVILIVLGLVLLLALIVVVKICKTSKAPLRPFN